MAFPPCAAPGRDTRPRKSRAEVSVYDNDHAKLGADKNYPIQLVGVAGVSADTPASP